jgi:hypothetical protein
MRFCPFCAQDNPDDARECVHCGKRLPALRQPKLTPAPRPSPPPPRPAPPRPAPRAPSLVPTLTPPTAPAGVPHVASPPTASTLTPPTQHKSHPPNGPLAKSASGDKTLKPLADDDDENEETMTREVPSPPSAPTGTLLGLPAQEIGSSTRPASASERDSGRRTTKPLGVAAIAHEAQRKPSFDDEAATTVDDAPTSPTPKLDEELESAQTRSRPAPRSRPLESLSTTPPPIGGKRPTPGYGIPTKPSPLPLSSTMPTKPTPLPQKPSYPNLRTPEPLPPPPGRVGNEAGSFPQLDMQPTPAIPTLALPPMPEHPKSGSIVDAVKYLAPLAKAMWARKKAQDAIRTLLHGDQRLMDSVLRDLGRVAREAEVNAPAIADEMRRIVEQEERRQLAEQQAAEGEAATKKEDDRWHFDQGERLAELARRDADVKIADEDLRRKAEERRAHEAERGKLDTQIRGHEKRAAAADAKAAKAEVTPPEKGGGPNTAANARAEATEARKQATALIPGRDAAKAEAEKLEGPIATLTQQLTDGRATIVQKRKELADAKLAHQKALADVQAAREKAAAERDAAERELTQRFVTAGTILNLNRVEHPKLQPLFARIDELKNGVNAREAAIVRLESERRLYDRAAVQKGLLTVGIAAGAVILLAIILIVLIAR